MRRLLFASAAVALLTLPIPVANAAPTVVDGGCELTVTSDENVTGGQDTYFGTVTLHAVVADPADPTPVEASGYCDVRVNNYVVATGTSVDGTAVLAGDDLVSYTASSTDTVEACLTVTFDSGSWSDCPPPIVPPTPPGADCPYGQVTGDITYSPGPDEDEAPQDFVMNIEADCAGTSPLAGHYAMTFTGSSNESCTSGSGSATVTGTGPNGSLTGTWSFTRGSIHYYGYQPAGGGSFTDATGTYQMAWWLDVFADGDACPFSSGSIVGHGLLLDTP